MVTRLEETNRIVSHLIDNPVFLGQPAGPESRKLSSQGFWFRNPCEWVPQSRSDDPQEPQRGLAISSNPVLKVIDEVSGENRPSFTHSG